MNTRRRLGLLTLLGLLALTSCGTTQPLTGEIVAKSHHPGCTVDQMIGTASGSLAYEETIDEAWVLAVRHKSTNPEHPDEYKTSAFHVDAQTWQQAKIGATHTESFPYWFLDECTEEGAHRN